jgi:hypothetical protein
MVKERKYGLLLVILPFIWLNQPGLDRIIDQKYILMMTLPPNHQCQTEKYLTGRGPVKALLVIVRLVQSLHL